MRVLKNKETEFRILTRTIRTDGSIDLDIAATAHHGSLEGKVVLRKTESLPDNERRDCFSDDAALIVEGNNITGIIYTEIETIELLKKSLKAQYFVISILGNIHQTFSESIYHRKSELIVESSGERESSNVYIAAFLSKKHYQQIDQILIQENREEFENGNVQRRAA